MAAPVPCPFQLLQANSDIIHLLMGMDYIRLRLLSVNRGKNNCMERCLLVHTQLSVVQSKEVSAHGRLVCIVAIGNTVGAWTLVRYYM